MDKADRFLTQTRDDFWDLYSGLSELTGLWERLEEPTKQIYADRYQLTAHRLWLGALDAAEQFSQQAGENPESVRAGDVETIAEFGLAELKEIGEKGIVKFDDYSLRFRIVEARVRRLLQQWGPPAGK